MLAGAKTMAIRPMLLVVACLTLVFTGTGCVALAVGGAAAAGGIGYAYYNGLLERHYLGPVEPTYQAARKALATMAMPITNEAIEGSRAHLEARTPSEERIRLWLEPVPRKTPADPVLTRVTVRVDVFGDRETSRKIFDAIDKEVGPSGIPPEERPLQATPAIQLSPPPVSPSTQPERILPIPMDQPGLLVPIPATR